MRKRASFLAFAVIVLVILLMNRASTRAEERSLQESMELTIKSNNVKH